MKKQEGLFIQIACILLLLLFVYTGSSKLMQYATFKAQLALQPFTKPYAALLAWALPATELLTGVAIAIKKYRGAGLWAAAVLMCLFSGYVLWVLLQPGAQRPCSCGGVIKNMGWKLHLFFNLFFTALAFAAIYFSHTHKRE